MAPNGKDPGEKKGLRDVRQSTFETKFMCKQCVVPLCKKGHADAYCFFD